MERLIRFDGKVVAVLPDGRYRVRFTNDHEITSAAARPAEAARLAIGEVITVEISPVDMTTGRLVFMHAEDK
jgi:translation initiation factor IF-1